jgi:hypothetical protein
MSLDKGLLWLVADLGAAGVAAGAARVIRTYVNTGRSRCASQPSKA